MVANQNDCSDGPAVRQSTGWPAAPAVTLAVLAPVIAEVLYGATRVSVIFVLIPQIAVWGCGALLVRYGVRRRRRGWLSLLLLGLALAIAEECVIQQTSLAPLVGLAQHAYGRVWGVNWVYFLWAVGYESVWVVVLPVKLTELLFPARRDELWLGGRGLFWAAGLFLAGSFIAWYSWTQHARTAVFHMPEYQPPRAYILLAVLAIALLAAASLGPWRPSWPGRLAAGGFAPQPRVVGLAALLFGLPWSVLVLFGLGMFPAIPFQVPLWAGAAVAVAVLLLFARWTSSSGWRDRHRLAAVNGGIAACMAGGFVVFAVGGALLADWIGKTILNITALVALARWSKFKLER